MVRSERRQEGGDRGRSGGGMGAAGWGPREAGATLPQVVAGLLTLAVFVGVLVFVALGRKGPVVLRDGPEPAAEGARGAPGPSSPGETAATGAGHVVTASPATEPAPEGPSPAEAEKGAVVSGTVRVAGTDEPAAGVKVVVRREGPSTGEGWIADLTRRAEGAKVEETDLVDTAGDDGTYRIEGIEAGEHRVFALRGETDFVSIPPSAGRRIAIGEDLAPQTVDVEVVRGGAIKGTVRDAAGEPLAGARVEAVPRDFFKDIFDPESDLAGFGRATSGDDGAYRIGGLRLAERYVVSAERSGKARAISGELAFEEGAHGAQRMQGVSESHESHEDPEKHEIVVDFILLDGSTISGSVSSADGPVLEGAEVQIAKTDAADLLQTMMRMGKKTDAAGAFAFEHLPAGTYRVTASKGGHAAGSRDVECDGESPVADVAMVLAAAADEGSGKVEGRVTDDLGTALEGVSLGLSGVSTAMSPSSHETSSGADGRFAFEGVAEGVYSLQASRPGHAPFLKAGVGAGTGPIDVVLRRAGRVSGRVVAGSATVGSLPAGRGGGPAPSGRPVAAGAGGSASSRGADARPVAGAVVRLVPTGEGMDQLTRIMAGQLGGATATAKTADDGTFILENVTPGRARVRAEASGLAPAHSEEIELAPGEEVAGVEVALSVGGIVRGAVVGPDGTPLADASVRAVEVAGGEWEQNLQKLLSPLLAGSGGASARTDAEGAFEIEHLPEAAIELSATHPDFAPSADLLVTLARDDILDGIRLRLRRSGKLIVTARKEREPLPGLMVQVMGAGPMKMSSTDADGKAVSDGLAPGDYLVQLIDIASMMSGKGMGLRQRAVTLEEGETAEVAIVLGEGAKVEGTYRGEIPKPMGMVSLRRPGGPAPEDQSPTDMAASIRAARYQVGSGFIAPDGTYSVEDIPDGEYILEVPRMPADISGAMQMNPEERMPLYRATVKVEGGKDVKHDIRPGGER